MSPAAGWLGDRHARLPTVTAGVLVWSAATIASGLAPSYALLLLARAVIGIGEASYAVVTPSLLSDLYPPDRRGRVGVASDHVGLTAPVLATGVMLVASGGILLAGRAALHRDLAIVGAAPDPPAAAMPAAATPGTHSGPR